MTPPRAFVYEKTVSDAGAVVGPNTALLFAAMPGKTTKGKEGKIEYIPPQAIDNLLPDG